MKANLCPSLRSPLWRAGLPSPGLPKPIPIASFILTGTRARHSKDEWSGCRWDGWLTATPSHTLTAGPLMPRATCELVRRCPSAGLVEPGRLPSSYQCPTPQHPTTSPLSRAPSPRFLEEFSPDLRMQCVGEQRAPPACALIVSKPAGRAPRRKVRIPAACARLRAASCM